MLDQLIRLASESPEKRKVFSSCIDKCASSILEETLEDSTEELADILDEEEPVKIEKKKSEYARTLARIITTAITRWLVFSFSKKVANYLVERFDHFCYLRTGRRFFTKQTRKGAKFIFGLIATEFTLRATRFLLVLYKKSQQKRGKVAFSMDLKLFVKKRISSFNPANYFQHLDLLDGQLNLDPQKLSVYIKRRLDRFI